MNLNPVVFFHIDEFNRDSITASVIKNYLKEQNIKVIYGNRRLSKFFNLKISSFFDAAIFPGIDQIDFYFNKKNKNTKLFALPTESIFTNNVTEKSFRWFKAQLLGTDEEGKLKKKDIGRIDRIYVWGDMHLELLKNEYPKFNEKFKLTGHPRHDKKVYKKNFIKNNKKINIGFVSRFDTINAFDMRTMLEQVLTCKTTGVEYFHDENTNIEDNLYKDAQDLRLFLEIISLLGNEYSFNIKPHPRENYKNWESFIKKYNIPLNICSRETPFTHWLADQDLIIAPPSTTFYDCAIMKKNAICTRRIVKNREKSLSNNSDDFDPILDFFPNPTSIHQIKKFIEDKTKINFEDEKLLNLLKKQTNYPNSKESLKILCEDLSSFLKNKKTNKIKKIFGLIIFELYRYSKNFKYLIFRILGIENKEESASFVMTSSKIKYINKLIEK